MYEETVDGQQSRPASPDRPTRRLRRPFDARELTKAAREPFRSKFEREVDPDGALSVEERLRRAEMARKAHFLRLALKSAQVRRKRHERMAAP